MTAMEASSDLKLRSPAATAVYDPYAPVNTASAPVTILLTLDGRNVATSLKPYMLSGSGALTYLVSWVISSFYFYLDFHQISYCHVFPDYRPVMLPSHQP